MLTSTFPRWHGDAVSPFVAHLAEDLVRLGAEVTVLAPHAKNAALKEWMNGVRVKRFRYSWPAASQSLTYDGGALGNLRRRPWIVGEIPGYLLSEATALYRLVSGGGVDVIHSHWILPQGFVAQIVSANLGIPHIATAHGSDVFGLQKWPLRAAKAYVIQRADRVTVNSRATATQVESISPRPNGIARIPMGVSFNEMAGSPARIRAASGIGQGALIVFVGRLVKAKGVDDLLGAVRILDSGGTDVQLVVAGDGPERTRLEALSKSLRIADRVDFAGWIQQKDLPALLGRADVFVGPSRIVEGESTEAQGLALLEAMAAGVPVVATSIGGIEEIVVEGKTGLVVPANDSEAIARAVQRLLADHSLVLDLTSKARTMVNSKYRRESTADRFLNLYKECLEESGGQRRGRS